MGAAVEQRDTRDEQPISSHSRVVMESGNFHNRFLLLDIIRSLACALIVFQHLTTYFKILNVSWGSPRFYVINAGEIGVTLFIILSGLSLQVKYGSKDHRYKDFIIRRFWRIYPVYWICLIIAAVIYMVIQYQAGNSLFHDLHYFDLMLSLTGMYALVGKWGGPFIATSWFIGPLVCLYLLFPLLSWSMSRKPLLTLLCLLAISAASRLLIGMAVVPSAESPVRWFPLCLVFEFGLGIYTAVVTDNLNKLKLRSTDRFFSSAADLLFPVFLIHLPLIPILLPFIRRAGFNDVISVFTYLSAVIVISWLIHLADTRIQNDVNSSRSKPHNPK